MFLYRGANYNLIKHNCNTFSEDLTQFLCGTSIPKYILELPQEILSTPLGQSLAPLIERIGNNSGGDSNGALFSFEPQITARESSPGFDELNNEIEEARLQSLALEKNRNAIKDKIAKKEKKKDKKKKKHANSTNCDESDSPYNSNQGAMSEVETAELNGGGAAAGHVIPSEMLPSEQALEDEAKERQADEERRKNREPPVVFKDIDVSLVRIF